MLTVISWFAARKGRRQLHELVLRQLTDKPTIIAVVSDQYTSESSLRPWTPLAEKFGNRLDLILAAEWTQEDRERDGAVLLQNLGVAQDAWGKLLRDEGETRTALLVRQKRPFALIDLFFLERGRFYGVEESDPREADLRADEEELARILEQQLGRPLPTEPPPVRKLQQGEHDFNPDGLCRACGEGRASLRICRGYKVEEGPHRDRFELIELD